MDNKKLTTIACIALGLIMIDYLTKLWAYNSLLPSGDEIKVLGSFLSFRFVWNPASAFGILKLNTLAFIILNLGISVFLITHFLKKDSYHYIIPSVAIMAGGWGNIIDRLIYGQVVDFIATLNGSFPVFNLADVFVVVGAFWLVGVIWIDDSRSKKQEQTR